ncbi:deoxyuridine triphosphatase [Murid herpesvirus 3]|uniref:Deoxyuridine triphosphatase n=2 Tax=Murid betaherpesvirus 3 TaxID=2560603 RepID=A0A1P8VIV2_9BETA|nr:deoxyuridine triphosphatase [Murine roseolovirus]APZ76274.1 deoxyuridine triphosphatase [Murid betaherpesvirus 3]AYH64763.1 deoxyuridine triphosphatase [Murid herpesvirus 3]
MPKRKTDMIIEQLEDTDLSQLSIHSETINLLNNIDPYSSNTLYTIIEEYKKELCKHIPMAAEKLTKYSNSLTSINQDIVSIKHSESSRMNIYTTKNKITLVNREVIWIPQEQVRFLNTGIFINLPHTLCGISVTITRKKFTCSTNLLTGSKNIYLYLLNLTTEPQMIEPMKLFIDIFIIPFFLPEPWQLINFNNPNNKIFSLQCKQDILFYKKRTIIIYFKKIFINPNHIAVACPIHSLLTMGIMVDTTFIKAGQFFSIKIYNTTNNVIFLPKNTRLCDVVFTGNFNDDSHKFISTKLKIHSELFKIQYIK